MNTKEMNTAWAVITLQDRTIFAIIDKIKKTSKTTADVKLKRFNYLKELIGDKIEFKSDEIKFFHSAKVVNFKELVEMTSSRNNELTV